MDHDRQNYICNHFPNRFQFKNLQFGFTVSDLWVAPCSQNILLRHLWALHDQLFKNGAIHYSQEQLLVSIQSIELSQFLLDMSRDKMKHRLDKSGAKIWFDCFSNRTWAGIQATRWQSSWCLTTHGEQVATVVRVLIFLNVNFRTRISVTFDF